PRSDVGTNYFCEKPLTLPFQAIYYQFRENLFLFTKKHHHSHYGEQISSRKGLQQFFLGCTQYNWQIIKN
ncbi:hypothetical protein, partial [uncultured Fibrobacter sp.]|uniref:hypothetical protein n=1 Tax=uncultured Fibrobacter sp. TaxID=261512 RepID=UPI0026346570